MRLFPTLGVVGTSMVSAFLLNLALAVPGAAQTVGIQVTHKALEQVDPGYRHGSCSLESATIPELAIEGFENFETSTQAVLAVLDACLLGGLATDEVEVYFLNGVYYLVYEDAGRESVIRAQTETTDGGILINDLYAGPRQDFFFALLERNGLEEEGLTQSIAEMNLLYGENSNPVSFTNREEIPKADALFIEGYLMQYSPSVPWTIVSYTSAGGFMGFQWQILDGDEVITLLTSREDTQVEVTFLESPIY